MKGERQNSDVDCRSHHILGLHLAANTRLHATKPKPLYLHYFSPKAGKETFVILHSVCAHLTAIFMRNPLPLLKGVNAS